LGFHAKAAVFPKMDIAGCGCRSRAFILGEGCSLLKQPAIGLFASGKSLLDRGYLAIDLRLLPPQLAEFEIKRVALGLCPGDLFIESHNFPRLI
jgi:hypothetical protein